MVRQASMDHYLEGIRLFNAGEYWHAHEQWEICWLASAQSEAMFYKGIIQAAAALEKWKRGQPRGMRLNYVKSRPKLAAFSPWMRGLHVAALITAMDQFVLNGGPPAPVPRITLDPPTAAALAAHIRSLEAASRHV
ncbi:protein of unknown function DUF309 [Roseiflexus castenholzii DSM 13941]|jgi:hypothetical protein|uniref:DUF309 domain-containing protein n=2 Tax=Roseiflexus castenholzii TaxID=120962 RepID=A7NK28_ROSCS|nr:protein of unknown function DUF309 [Roseiflexus castenholzii DSM 13941]